MAINNLNPRRVVWFSPNEPSNKYDIWLSRNAHYNENGEPTTDSNSQRDCDYIFKIYDCGKWNPIVGFNTTAANKIDIVEGTSYTPTGESQSYSGKTLYHPAIFTDESPNELYDAGSLGELLKDTHFVTEGDWNDIYNEYIKTIIEQYPFDLWPAEQNELGGIFADRFASTHIDSTAANKTWMAQCKYKYNASSNYNLYIHAKDIISAVNDYQTDHPNEPGIQPSSDFELWLADTTRIGGIKAAQDPNTADDCRNIPIVLAGPTVGSVWGLPFGSGTYPGDTDNETEYLYLPGWALLEWMKNPYFNQQEPQPFISGWKGVDTELRTGSDLIWVGLSGVIPENTGKFCTIQLDNTDPSGATIDWVDLPEGTRYSAGTGITISQQNEISIDTTNASTNQVLTKTANSVGWSTPSQQIQYTGTNLIKVNSSNNEIGINMDSNPSSGDIIICDSGVAKWGAVPNPTIGGMSINCNNGGVTLNDLQLTSDTSIAIDEEQSSSRAVYNLNTWNYYNLSNCKTLSITSVANTMEPVYIRIISAPYGITCNGDKIDIGSVLTDTSQKDILVTLQFGIAKFEEII